MFEKIESMNTEQIESLMRAVSKRAAALGGHKSDKELLDISMSILKMKPKKLDSITKVIEASKKLDDLSFKYIGTHATDISLGKSVRVPRIEFPWSKGALIRLSKACRDADNFMYNFSRLPAKEQGNIGDITKLFTSIEDMAKKISSISASKSPRTNTRKTKTLKAAKDAATNESTKVDEVEKKPVVKKPAPNETTETAKKTITTTKKEATVVPEAKKVETVKPAVVTISEPVETPKEAVAK